jgi:hypothetical protein
MTQSTILEPVPNHCQGNCHHFFTGIGMQSDFRFMGQLGTQLILMIAPCFWWSNRRAEI